MVPLQRFANSVLADVIRRQPPSPERTAFAWQIAVGSALARSTTIFHHDDVLIVRPRDERWKPELVRSADVIVQRLQHLLGPSAVRRLDIRKCVTANDSRFGIRDSG